MDTKFKILRSYNTELLCKQLSDEVRSLKLNFYTQIQIEYSTVFEPNQNCIMYSVLLIATKE